MYKFRLKKSSKILLTYSPFIKSFGGLDIPSTDSWTWRTSDRLNKNTNIFCIRVIDRTTWLVHRSHILSQILYLRASICRKRIAIIKGSKRIFKCFNSKGLILSLIINPLPKQRVLLFLSLTLPPLFAISWPALSKVFIDLLECILPCS